MAPELIGGVISGVVGLLVFLVIHNLWIKPIWFIFIPGLLIACLGGLAVGWAYKEIRSELPPRPWTFLAVVLLIGVILAPSILLAQFKSPLLDLTAFIIPADKNGIAIRRFMLDLILTATFMGGIAGWLIGRSAKATLATALAGLVFALGPGHNIPLLGNTPAAGKGLMLLLAVVFVSALVLVETSAGLTH